MRQVVVFLLVLMWVSPSQARISVPPPVISNVDLREAIYAGNFERVDAVIGETQTMFRQQKATSEDVRRLFEVFYTTSPRIIAFTEQWLLDMPASPYAQTAQAWILVRSGWLIRGDRWGHQTYPMALQLHSLNHSRAMEYAKAAYAIDPYLLSASDAIIRLANTGGDKVGAIQVLDETMQRYPNWGTLYRALDLANRGYGGSPELAEEICAYYGPTVTSPVENMTRFCRIEAMFRGRIGGGRKALKELVKQEDSGTLDYIRAWLAIDNGATQEEAEFAKWYFEEHQTTDVELARNFDIYLAFRFNFDFVEPQTIERAKARAAVAIEHDPYNPHWLDILEMPSITKTRQGDSVKSSSFDLSFTVEQGADHARRRLLVSPYDPDLWYSYGTSLRRILAANGGYGGGLTTGDDAAINSIVYSRHDPKWISRFLIEKLWQLESLQEFNTLYPKEHWAKDAAGIDIESQIICPTLRTKRLLELVADETDQDVEGMHLTQSQLDTYNRSENWALRHHKCTGVLQSPIDMLWFEPVEIDLKAGVY